MRSLDGVVRGVLYRLAVSKEILSKLLKFYLERKLETTPNHLQVSAQQVQGEVAGVDQQLSLWSTRSAPLTLVQLSINLLAEEEQDQPVHHPAPQPEPPQHPANSLSVSVVSMSNK